MSPVFFYYFTLMVVVHAGKICPSIHVQNDLVELNKLENCSVIVGNLTILFLEQTDDPADFEKFTFPELTEITGYFLMLRVYGIQSLGDLFPNLAVIRGRDLFRDYAFILFEVPDLKEVGHSKNA